MYKKLTCAFCFVISTFIIAVLVYFLAKSELFSKKPPEVQVPKLGVYLLNGTTGVERLIDRSVPGNTEFILNFQSLELTDFDVDEAGVIYYETPSEKQRNRLRIRCHSNYPVQLKYIGYGNVTEASNLNRRQIEEFTDRSTYKYLTELELSRVDEGITGMYDCQVRDQESGVMKGNTFIYIYAAGLKTFVSHSNRELVVETGSLVEIPCPVSHPSKSIALFLVKPLMEGEVTREVDAESIHAFDPKRGFILHPNNYGLFFCKDRKTGETSGRITVFMPLNKVVKGSSLRIYSQNVDNKHRSLKLECRARDPVELRFFNFIKFSKQPRTLKASKNESQDAFPHIVRIKLNKEWFRGNMSIVECITVGGRRVIKTWKFLKEDLPELQDDQDDTLNPQVKLVHVKNEGYQCCSYRINMRPVLRTYPCSTPTECDLRLPCLSINPLHRTQGAPSCPRLESANDDIYEGDKECTILKLRGNSSGIIRCSLDADVRDYTYFQAENFEGTYSSIMNTGKKKIEAGAVLKLTQKGFRSSNTQKGAPIRFECEGSKLHFARGFQWAMEKMHEPLKYLNTKGLSYRSGEFSEANSTLYQEWIDVPYTDHASKRIYCFAPLINPPLYGQQWTNVSIGVRYNVFW